MTESSPYREMPADEVIKHMDGLFARYRISDRQVKRRIYLTLVIGLILGFIGGHYYKGMVPKGTVTEAGKAKEKTSKMEHVFGYQRDSRNR